MEIPPDVVEAARSVSRIAGVGAPALLALLAHESAFQRDARSAASSALGPAQFLEGTWLEMIRRYGAAFGLGRAADQIVPIGGRLDIADPKLKAHVLGLRRDPQLAAAMAARYLATVGDDLAKLLGRRVSEIETRIAYILGAGGAAILLKTAGTSPKMPAAALLPEAAKANPELFNTLDGKPRSVIACLDALRAALIDEARRTAVELRRPPERVGDLTAAQPAG